MSIAAFNTLMTYEGPTILGSDQEIVNYVQDNTYTASRLIAGREAASMFSSGPSMKKPIFLEHTDRGEWYDANGYERDEQNPQPAVMLESNWRYYMASITWNKQEIKHSVETGLTKDRAAHKYADVMFQKKQDLQQGLVNAMESMYWRVPVQSEMEGINAKYPHSIPAFICESTHGTSGIGVPTDASGAQSWSSMLGLDVSTAGLNTGFDNKRATYTSLGGADQKANDMVGALKRMRRRLHYKPLPMGAQYGTKESSPNVIFASEMGVDYLDAALRNGTNHQWSNANVNGANLQIAGIEVEYLSSLEDYAGFDAGSSLGTEATATNKGPRFWFVSQKGLCPQFFEGEFFDADEPMRDSRSPNDWVQHYHLWAQLFPMNRRHLGIVSPVGDLVTP